MNNNSSGERPRLAFVCEGGTDVRMVSGLAKHFQLTLLVRPAYGGRAVSWPYEGEEKVETVEGPAGRIAFTAFAGRWLVRNARHVDLVLAQNYGFAALAANAARTKTKTPTWLLVCSPVIEYFRCRWQKREISPLEYASGLAALEATKHLNGVITDKYIVLSEYLADVVGKSRASVVPIYGVDTALFRPVSLQEKRALRQSLGLPLDAKIVFYSSRVAPEKDTEGLLDALRLLKERGVQPLLLNLSGGHERLLSLAKKAGVHELVIAHDAVHPIHGLPKYYQVADVCAQVSLEEGLGFSPLEALACEIPVVATAVGGLRETVRDGETGLTFPRGNAKALADKLEYALSNPDQMLTMARKGRRMVQERFEADKCFEAFSNMTRAALGRATAVGTS